MPLDDIGALRDQLSQLSNDYYSDKRSAKEQVFMDKYGSKFKNNKSIGLSIMEELERQHIDTSAADEAVEKILDELREECNGLIDIIGSVREVAEKQQDKLDAIEQAVEQATGENPEASKDSELPTDLPNIGEGGDMSLPLDTGAAPAEPLAPADMAPPPDAVATGAEPPAPADMAPPPDAGVAPAEPPAEELPPQNTISDERLKQIQGIKAKFNERRSKRNAYKPSSGILGAIQSGGY